MDLQALLQPPLQPQLGEPSVHKWLSCQGATGSTASAESQAVKRNASYTRLQDESSPPVSRATSRSLLEVVDEVLELRDIDLGPNAEGSRSPSKSALKLPLQRSRSKQLKFSEGTEKEGVTQVDSRVVSKASTNTNHSLPRGHNGHQESKPPEDEAQEEDWSKSALTHSHFGHHHEHTPFGGHHH